MRSTSSSASVGGKRSSNASASRFACAATAASTLGSSCRGCAWTLVKQRMAPARSCRRRCGETLGAAPESCLRRASVLCGYKKSSNGGPTRRGRGDAARTDQSSTSPPRAGSNMAAAARARGTPRSPAAECQKLWFRLRRLGKHCWGARRSWRPPDSRHVEARSSITWAIGRSDDASRDYRGSSRMRRAGAVRDACVGDAVVARRSSH